MAPKSSASSPTSATAGRAIARQRRVPAPAAIGQTRRHDLCSHAPSAAQVVPIIRAEVRALDPDIPLADVKTMGTRYRGCDVADAHQRVAARHVLAARPRARRGRHLRRRVAGRRAAVTRARRPRRARRHAARHPAAGPRPGGRVRGRRHCRRARAGAAVDAAPDGSALSGSSWSIPPCWRLWPRSCSRSPSWPATCPPAALRVSIQ